MTDVTGAERLSEEMALPTPNLPLLRKVLDHIDAHPDEWDQSTFEGRSYGCGTTRCVAGWANFLTYGDALGDMGNGATPDQDACAALGLTRGEGDALFYDTLVEGVAGSEWRVAERANVQAAAEQIAARAGERL